MSLKRLTWTLAVFVIASLLVYELRHFLNVELRYFFSIALCEFIVLAFTALGLVLSVKGETLRNVFLTLAVLLIGLAAAEVWFGFNHAALGQTEGATWSGSFMKDNFFRDDPDLGYGITKKQHTYESIKKDSEGRVVYDVHYSINENGFRKTPDVNGPVAYFFGCSITMGVGIDDEQTLPIQFSRVTGYQSINFGVLGYGTHQVVRSLETDVPAAAGYPRPDLVVYTAVLDHINRAAGRGAIWDKFGPRYDVNGLFLGQFNDRNRKPDFWARADTNLRFWWRTYSAIRTREEIDYRYQTRTPDEQNRFIALTVKARDLVRDRYGDVPFVVLFWDTWPDPSNSEKEANWIADNLRSHDISVLQLSRVRSESGDDRYYIPGDSHPNGEGDRLAANALAQWVSNRSAKVAVHAK